MAIGSAGGAHARFGGGWPSLSNGYDRLSPLCSAMSGWMAEGFYGLRWFASLPPALPRSSLAPPSLLPRPSLLSILSSAAPTSPSRNSHINRPPSSFQVISERRNKKPSWQLVIERLVSLGRLLASHPSLYSNSPINFLFLTLPFAFFLSLLFPLFLSSNWCDAACGHL